MKHTTKRLNKQLLSAAVVLTFAIFMMGCSSTTNLSSSGVKGLKFVKATPANVTTAKRNVESKDLALAPTHSFTAISVNTQQPTILTASSNNEVVLNHVAENKTTAPTNVTVLLPVQNEKISGTPKSDAAKVQPTKPKSNKTKLFLVGLLAYLTLGGALATAKHVQARKAAKANGGDCKNWIVCVLLCFFLGGLGIHRFYMGYIWQGVVQLLTGGGCGIWALIDFIRILIKDLNPKDGDYC